jgi:hypothetical protein
VSDRLLNPESLPATLWDKEEKFLLLPVEFAAAYERLIDRYGLRTLATSRSEQGFADRGQSARLKRTSISPSSSTIPLPGRSLL